MRRTWSPRGQKPILMAPSNWKCLSAIASLITTPAARRVGLCLRLQLGTVKQPEVLAYLKVLKRHVNGRNEILLWDQLPAHRGTKVQDWIAGQSNWLTIEYLPPYAPELNPVEYFWSHLSRTRWLNSSAKTSMRYVSKPEKRPAESGTTSISAKPSSNTADCSSRTIRVATFCNGQ
ncbi:MAG: transposase [Planctomycetaceae bacterium]|nr:transposase [Planctomycetaceae bacterium]